jgi:hypothetical protein
LFVALHSHRQGNSSFTGEATISPSAWPRGFRILKDWSGAFSLIDNKIAPPQALMDSRASLLPASPRSPTRAERERGARRYNLGTETHRVAEKALGGKTGGKTLFCSSAEVTKSLIRRGLEVYLN